MATTANPRSNRKYQLPKKFRRPSTNRRSFRFPLQYGHVRPGKRNHFLFAQQAVRGFVQGLRGIGGAAGDRTLSELASKFGVHGNLISQWKRRLVANIARVSEQSGKSYEAGTSSVIRSARIVRQRESTSG